MRLRLSLIALVTFISSWLLLDRGFYSLDEGSLLSIASRIEEGQVLYRDVCTAIFPGVYYTQAAAFALFGRSIATERWLAFAFFAATVCALYRLGRCFLPPEQASLGVLFFLFLRPLLFPIQTVLSYTQIAFLFAILALPLLLGDISPRGVLLAGCFAALCGLYKQNYGFFFVLVALFVLLTNQSARQRRAGLVVRFLGAGALTTVPVLGYLAATGAFHEFYRNTILAPIGIVPGSYKVPFAPLVPIAALASEPRVYLPSPLADLLLPTLQKTILTSAPPLLPLAIKLVYTVPLVITVLAIIRSIRDRSLPLLATAALNGGLYLAIFPRSDFAHLTAVAPLSALLLAALLRKRIWPRLALVGAAIPGLFSLILIVVGFDTPLVTNQGTVLLPRGMAIQTARILDRIARTVPPKEPIFVAPVDAGIYFLSDHRNPTRFDYIEPVNVGREQADEIVSSLAGVRYLILSDRDLSRNRVPPVERYAPRFWRYLLDHFETDPAILSPIDDLYLCRRRTPPSPPHVDLLEQRPVIDTIDRNGSVAAARDRCRLVSFLASRVLEVAPPKDPSHHLLVTYHVAPMPSGATLRFRLLSRQQNFWQGAGAGLRFRLWFNTSGESHLVSDDLYDPGANRQDRQGRLYSLHLSPKTDGVTFEFFSPIAIEVEGMGIAEPGIYLRERGALNLSAISGWSLRSAEGGQPPSRPSPTPSCAESSPGSFASGPSASLPPSSDEALPFSS